MDEQGVKRIFIQGWPAWLLPDGRVMFPVAGGAPDDDAGGDNGGDGDGDPDKDADDPDKGGDDPAAELQKWKSLARKHEADAKKNAEAAKRLQELEDAKKSDLEKLTEAQKAAETRAAEAEQRALRLEVAAEKGLTPTQAKRLIGTTKEELEADADDLLASFKSDDDDGGTDTGPRRRPRERMRSTRPGPEPEKDVKEVVAAIPRSRF